jgi:hypothetical protein
VERPLGALGLELVALDGPLERPLDALARADRGAGVGLHEHHLEAGPRADLRDARAHDAAADDTGACQGHRNAWMPVSALPTTSAWMSAVPS